MSDKKREIRSEGASGRAPKSGTENEEPVKEHEGREDEREEHLPKIKKQDVGEGKPLH